MEKIRTIFDRNWNGNRKVNSQLVVEDFDFTNSIATEKLDGTNIRITVRSETVVRVEKRKNPNKVQKQTGIVDPWYVDAHETASEDAYIFEAVSGTDFQGVPDGEWSAEALGPKIQGNPLKLTAHQLFLFSVDSWKQKIVFQNVPIDFEGLKSWLSIQKSLIGNDCGIEGIVWHDVKSGQMVKIKVKDFE